MALSDTTFPVTVTAADTQATLDIPIGVRQIILTNLSDETLRFAFKTGVVANPETLHSSRKTLLPKGKWESGEVEYATAGTLYYASSLVGHRFDVRYSPEPAAHVCGACR